MTVGNALNIGSAGLVKFDGTSSFTGVTTTQYNVLVGDVSNGIANVSPGTSGYVLTSNGPSAAPSFQAAGGGGGISWTNVTGTSQSMAVNNAYIANNASLVTLTLPATAAIGSIVQVVGNGAGGWKIAQNSGQTIHFGNVDTTTTTGHLDSTNRYDAIQLVCTATNTDWVSTGVVQGNISYT